MLRQTRLAQANYVPVHASTWEKKETCKRWCLHFAIFLTLGKFQFSKRKSLIDHDDSDNINNKHQFYRLAKHQLGMCITPSHLIWLFIFKKAWRKCFSHIFTRALENVVCLGELRLSQVSNSPRADVFLARLDMMLNFNISKVAYLSSLSSEREKILTSGCHFWHPGRQPPSCLKGTSTLTTE